QLHTKFRKEKSQSNSTTWCRIYHKNVKGRSIMQAKPAIESATPALDKEQEKKSILLVDEDEPLRLVLGMLLENDGYAVTTCGDEIEAIKLIERNSFDFVISDHSSSGVDGLKVLEAVKQL